MSECVYGQCKKRFPILRQMRTHFELSQKIIFATAILLNIGQLWEDYGLEDEQEDRDSDSDDGNNGPDAVIQDSTSNYRVRGQIERDRLKDSMHCFVQIFPNLGG